MRIIDKRRDYYDCGMAFGYEESIVYVRSPKEIKVNEKGYCYRRDFESIYIGFCGKIYFAILAGYQNVCYDLNDLDNYVSGKFSKKDKQSYFDGRYCLGNSFYSRGSLKHRFEEAKNKSGYGYEKLFIEHNTPIFVVNECTNSIFINPILKEYQFYRVVDPYTAFQEVSMYVGGVLRSPTKPIPDIPDTVMRDIKGFDKWSFKKEPKG